MWLPKSFPSFQAPSCRAEPFRTCCLSQWSEQSLPHYPHPSCWRTLPSGHNKGHRQLHSPAGFPYPQPHWSHPGPQACQRAASLCRSQHTEYLMSDERFHLLTQEKWQNNADRDTASPLTGGLPWPCLSTPHPERTPTAVWRESS